MRGQQRLLQGVRRVLGGVAGAFGDVPQVVVVPREQCLEGVPIAGDVRSQQVDVRGLTLGIPPEDSHRRMLAQFAGPRAPGADYVAALKPMSAMDDWFLPPELSGR